jgi:ABC-type Fe3+-citrate transport system substrate-binding protein
MNMRKIWIRGLAPVLISVLFGACQSSKTKESDTDLKQLMSQVGSFKRPTDPKRVQMVEDKYGSKVSGGSSAWSSCQVQTSREMTRQC